MYEVSNPGVKFHTMGTKCKLRKKCTRYRIRVFAKLQNFNLGIFFTWVQNFNLGTKFQPGYKISTWVQNFNLGTKFLPVDKISTSVQNFYLGTILDACK
jgi:hypothetical protein